MFTNVRFLHWPQLKYLKWGVASCLGSNERGRGKELVLSSGGGAVRWEVAGKLGGTLKLPRSPLQCHCRAWVVLLREKIFLFTLLVCKLLNACHCYFSQQLLLLKLPNICLVLWLLVELVIVMLSLLFPILVCCTERVLGSGNLGSGYSGVF